MALAIMLPASAMAQKWQEFGLSLDIEALEPDQVRAFFTGRGFSSEEAGFVATNGCIFRSAIGNAGTNKTDPEISIDLTEWRINERGQVKIREDWDAVWKKRGADEDAQTAFHWAIFPTRQNFGPTDYNWGFLSFGLSPGTSFDLEIIWRLGRQKHVKQMKALKCG